MSKFSPTPTTANPQPYTIFNQTLVFEQAVADMFRLDWLISEVK